MAKKHITDIILNSFENNFEICTTKNGKKKIRWTYILTSLGIANNSSSNKLNNTILREIKIKLSSSKRCRNESKTICKNNNIEIQNNVENNIENNIEYGSNNFKKILKHSLYSIRKTGAVKRTGEQINYSQQPPGTPLPGTPGTVGPSIKIFWKSVENRNNKTHKQYTNTQRSKIISNILARSNLVSQIKQKTLINENINNYKNIVDWFKIKIAKMKKDNLGIYEKIDRITHLLYMNYEIIKRLNPKKENSESEIAYWYRILGDLGIKGKTCRTIKDRLLERFKYNKGNNRIKLL